MSKEDEQRAIWLFLGLRQAYIEIMKVIVAEKCGFCLGVKNAIKMAEQTLTEQDTVYSLGSIIHNQDVVKELAKNGLKTVKNNFTLQHTIEDVEKAYQTFIER